MACDHRCSCRTAVSLAIENALSFFQLSCGRWRSQRSVHHLLHRRAEAGGSLIVVEELAASDQRLQELAQLHGQDPAVLHCLRKMWYVHACGAGQVGNRACHAQGTVGAAAGPTQLRGGMAQKVGGCRVELCMLRQRQSV